MAAAIETKLYVTNFPSSATRQQLQQFFSRFGRVQECAIMWNSYAFVHYATMEEARRALDQSNGAMFLNRKLIVQLSTSRFRPQPKESNNSISQSPKKLMIMSPSSSIAYHNSTGGLNTIQQQQSTLLPQQYTYSESNYDMMTSNGFHSQSSSSILENQNLYRSLSPLSQDMNNYYSQYSTIPIDQMTPASLLKTNHIKSNKNLKTDIGVNGEIPKLYCTNLPDNCKANDLQRLFSSFGHVIDCVILWDYYAFITYKTFLEAEQALMGLNGFIWKDRRLIIEWSRASGRRQQQISSSPTSQKLNSFCSEISTSPSSCTRPTTLLAHPSVSNNQFYGNNSPKILSPLLPSPLKSQSPHHNTFNQNLALMSIMQQQQQQQQPFLHHHTSNPYNGTYANGNNTEVLSNENQQIFDGLTNSSSNHRLDLSSFIDTNSSNTNTIFSSSSELNTPSSVTSISNVYQPSDIANLLEPLSSDVSTNDKTDENLMNDIKNTLPLTLNNVPPSCSSAAAAGVAALFQENLLSSLFNSFEPFSKLFPNDDQSATTTTTSSYYNHFSPLLTTAPDNSHYPMSYGHNISWH
ncbi:unnamed protein product [Rotaria sordida]|uniref:RRM domain-containing protein n=1 Tax=Rotaria sordida TaxID=392033 RepID=A0A814E131_9BILA|nr:unnamed protein product [Rotaria sordida]CAF3850276.1 unnamed protein product [Rotaria sordida]